METLLKKVISQSKTDSGSLLNALHAVQAEEGYISEAAIAALATEFSVPKGKVYDTASFYSMLHFTAPAKINVQICRGAPCHVAGAMEVIAALEEALGIQMGERTKDNKYALSYTECIGQCQASPSLLINGELYTGMTAQKVKDLFREGGQLA